MVIETTQHKQDCQAIAVSNLNTVVSQFEPRVTEPRNYQTEDNIEKSLIAQLKNLGYSYLNEDSTLKSLTPDTLKQNLRARLEELNKRIAQQKDSSSKFTGFTDNEWNNFFENTICRNDDDFKTCTARLRDHGNLEYTDAEGNLHYIQLIDRKNASYNTFQVINQYVDNGVRYDVTILINGLPLVAIELKKPQIDIKDAYNQIGRYYKGHFSGLFRYLQLFIISTGSQTKYYSNTVFDKRSNLNGKDTGYSFTSTWTDSKNNPINDLLEFAHYFLNRNNLFNILTRYCVFDTEQNLKVLRPYQICAVEAIINRVRNRLDLFGEDRQGGYIWHTTGSGKTLTSFKVAQLLTSEHNIKKVFFVVDRKDLDSQTIQEFNKFRPNSVSALSDTRALEEIRANIESTSLENRIIVTTIQKLTRFLKNKASESHGKFPYNEKCVFVFDECHRTQFGDMHKEIKKKFKKSMQFGFTGTPIFTENSIITTKFNDKSVALTTELIFGDCLHEYKINNAITDHNVLPFYIHYMTKQNVEDFHGEPVYDNEERMRNVAQYILDNFATYTNPQALNFTTVKKDYAVEHFDETQRKFHKKSSTKVPRFNSIFAVDSIDSALKYYNIFKDLQKDIEPQKRLRITTIFSSVSNEGEKSNKVEKISTDNLERAASNSNSNYTLEDENTENLNNLEQPHFEQLQQVIEDYNKMFGTAFAGTQIHEFYKDISIRLKNNANSDEKIDILIVVNMFLTGFDAPKLNTIWVDRNLKHHGLIQALSRTNRIYADVKPCGFVVSFRDLRENVTQALKLFANSDSHSTVELPNFEQLFNGYMSEDAEQQPVHVPGYKDYYTKVLEMFNFQGANYAQKPGFENEEFVENFNQCLRARIILKCWSEFSKCEKELEKQYADSSLDVFSYLLGQYNSISRDLREVRIPDTEEETEENKTLVAIPIFEIELVNAMAVDSPFIEKLIQEGIANGVEREKLIKEIRMYADTNPTIPKEYTEVAVHFVQTTEAESNQEIIAQRMHQHFLMKLDADIENILIHDIEPGEVEYQRFCNYLKEIFNNDRSISLEGELNFLKKPGAVSSFKELIENNKKSMQQRAEFVSKIESLYATYNKQALAEDIEQIFAKLALKNTNKSK